MKKLQKELGLTYLFISHDLAVVSHLSDKVGVMYLGRLVEWADTKTLFRAPKHPYTKMLLDAIPDLNLSEKARTPVAGEVPSPINPPSGCHFHPRCPWSNERCRTELPTLMDQQQQSVACHAVEENRIWWDFDLNPVFWMLNQECLVPRAGITSRVIGTFYRIVFK